MFTTIIDLYISTGTELNRTGIDSCPNTPGLDFSFGFRLYLLDGPSINPTYTCNVHVHKTGLLVNF